MGDAPVLLFFLYDRLMSKDLLEEELQATPGSITEVRSGGLLQHDRISSMLLLTHCSHLFTDDAAV